MENKKTIELVLDIETIKLDLENDFSPFEQSLLTKYDNEESQIRNRMALYPQTGAIVSIGAKNIISQKGFVVFQAGSQFKEHFQEEDRNLTFYGCMDEQEVLETFWNLIGAMEKAGFHFNRLITYNGKKFDLPFLFMRSAVHGVEVKHSLGYRGGAGFHCDLLEETTFNRKIRKFSIEIIARALGIPCHREEEHNGKKIWEWFEAGAFDDIAYFCYEDVELTEKIYRALHKSWKLFL